MKVIPSNGVRVSSFRSKNLQTIPIWPWISSMLPGSSCRSLDSFRASLSSPLFSESRQRLRRSPASVLLLFYCISIECLSQLLFSVVAKNSSLSTTADALLSSSRFRYLVKFNEVAFDESAHKLVLYLTKFMRFSDLLVWQAAMISVATMRQLWHYALRAAVVPMLTESSLIQDGIESTLSRVSQNLFRCKGCNKHTKSWSLSAVQWVFDQEGW